MYNPFPASYIHRVHTLKMLELPFRFLEKVKLKSVLEYTRGDASPSGGAKEILVCQDPKKISRWGRPPPTTPTPTEVQTDVKVEMVM